MNSSCLEKQQAIIRHLFPENFSADFLYETLIELGKKNKNYDLNKKTPDRLITGCQSDLYLYEVNQEGRLFFFTYTDAFISGGLASLFTEVYSQETPETVLTCPPHFFTKIQPHLSIGRANGGESLLLHMRKKALTHLL